MLGLVFAFLGVFFGQMFQNPYLDGAASVTIGLLLMGVAFILAFETKSLLLGEGVDEKTLEDIRRLVESVPAVEKASEILTMYMGPYELLVNLSVYFKAGITDRQMHQAIHSIEEGIQQAYPECTRIYIEAESLSKK